MVSGSNSQGSPGFWSLNLGKFISSLTVRRGYSSMMTCPSLIFLVAKSPFPCQELQGTPGWEPEDPQAVLSTLQPQPFNNFSAAPWVQLYRSCRNPYHRTLLSENARIANVNKQNKIELLNHWILPIPPWRYFIKAFSLTAVTESLLERFGKSACFYSAAMAPAWALTLFS